MLENIKISRKDGIGPKTFEILTSNGITTINDIINIFPTKYINFNETTLDTENIFIKGVVFSDAKNTFVKKNLSYTKFDIEYNNDIYKVVFFNREYMYNKIHVGNTIYISGKYDSYKKEIQANNLYFNIKENTIEPSYDFHNIPSKTLKKIINSYLDKYGIYLKEYLPSNLIDKYDIPTLYYMYKYIHNPNSVKDYERAYKRLKYEEFLTFELKLQYSRKENKKVLKTPKKWDVNVIRDFIKTIPFELTDSQKEVVNEIYKDLKSNYPSNRLIEGDVGSGKTIVAALAIYAVALDNYEVCFMAPTEILAYQHYQTLSNIFKNTPIRIEILTSSIKGKKRDELLNKIKKHEVDVIIGTHALFTEDIIYDNLGLVITDEQHRFGVKQRQALREKGFNPDVLYLTATPIPRTLAISVFGDMDLSVIKSMPKGRKDIKTKVVLESNLDACLNFIKDELDKGYQAYVISPLIEESKKLDLHDVFETSSMLEKKFNNYSIKVLHGKMKQSEKDEIMNDFKNNKFQILVSTTVIEVGIDNPNATVMLIFNAERFGLSQLHQLRGRVGRGQLESYCFLVTNNSDVERLKIIENTKDGFKLAECDLKLRGPGDFFGERQSGLPSFKYGNLINDYSILEDAKEDAYNIIFNDDISRYDILYDKVLKEMNSIKD